MLTYRKVISTIRGMYRLISSDAAITDRVLMNEIKNAANLIVGQSLNKQKYWSSPTLFTFVPCIKMKKVPLAECCEIVTPTKVAKSISKLPKIGEGIYGLSIQGIMSVDGSIRFKETSPDRYANLLKLNVQNQSFFWVMNNHLYISNPSTKAVNAYIYFTEPVDNKLLFPEKCECSPTPPKDFLCQNPLDHEFKFIDERLFDLYQLVYKNLMSTYFNVKQDVTSNNKDEQAKNES